MKLKLKSLIKEGAWGYDPLDNDSASDWKWKFGNMIIEEIKDKMKSNDFNYKYYAVGMWEYFKKELDEQYSFFKRDEIKEMNSVSNNVIKELLENPEKLINKYKDHKIVKRYLLNLIY